jgi:serine/threonine protein kinase
MLTVDFKKQNLLGSGAYGAVYLGKFNSKDVAVKRFLGSSSSTPWNQNALRELVAMSSIPDHPHVMRLEYAFSISSKAYLVFPRLKQTLYSHIKVSRPKKEDVLKWTSQILRAVSHMHTHGFIHRDIKLENILLDGQDNAYIADLGMARFAPLGCEHAPMTGNVCSLWTRPPELVISRNERTSYDERIDSWSVGCVMLALATGRYVFRSGSDGGTMSAVFGLLGTPTGWNYKGYANKSREERLKAIEAATERDDLPPYFYATLIDLLAVDFHSRSRIIEVSKYWPHENESLLITINRIVPDDNAIVPFLHAPTIVSKSFVYKKQISIWIWDTINELKMHSTSALYSFYCWLRLKIPSGKEVLYAAASCSLISTLNEVAIKTPSTWSKSIGCKVKHLQDAEIEVIKQTSGRLFLPIGLKCKKSIACAYIMLIASDYSIETILESPLIWKKKEIWKTARLIAPKIAAAAEE